MRNNAFKHGVLDFLGISHGRSINLKTSFAFVNTIKGGGPCVNDYKILILSITIWSRFCYHVDFVGQPSPLQTSS